MSGTLYIIPVRGGSKGLSGKNSREVGGLPLVGRAVRLALCTAEAREESSLVTVNTDDEELARLGRKWGAQVFRRPAGLARDETPTMDVILHQLRQMTGFDRVVTLQATAPLTEPRDLLAAVEVFDRAPHRPLVSVTDVEHPLEWCFSVDGDDTLRARDDGAIATRRQDTQAAVRLNGAIYIASPAWLDERGTYLVPGFTRAFCMPSSRSVDIDTVDDLALAEALHSRRARSSLCIGDRLVADGQPCFVIAEAGVNHNGNLELAKRLVQYAARSGADAVKFQTFVAERLARADAGKVAYQRERTDGASQLEMLEALELDETAHRSLQQVAADEGILFLSTPFDEKSADMLDALGIVGFKLPSGEVTNTPFLHHVAAKGRPLVLSTGMSTIEEVVTASDALGAAPTVLLHCVSAYPTALQDVHLRSMDTIAAATRRLVGFSDHTSGTIAGWAAVARGACVLEKHFTSDRRMDGPDHAASLEPDELSAYVEGVRQVEALLGERRKAPRESEAEARLLVRKSLVAARDLAAGTVLGADDLVALRPADGISPSEKGHIVGRRLSRPLERGEPLRRDALGGDIL